MLTIVRPVDPEDPEPEIIEEAAAIIRDGGLVAFPTETVYGLGADALNPGAVAEIYRVKGRPPNNPVIAHVSSLKQARSLVTEWPDMAQKLAEAFWPGPLTLVLPRSSCVPGITTAGGPRVAIRLPAHPVARKLIEAARTPIAAPSANPSNRISPTTAAHVLKGLEGKIPLVLDAGTPAERGVESTVVAITAQGWEILRPGPVSALMMESFVPGGEVRTDGKDAEELSSRSPRAPGGVQTPEGDEGNAPLASPGTLPRHYCPDAELILFRGKPDYQAIQERLNGNQNVALVVTENASVEAVPGDVAVIRMPVEPGPYAAGLYARLHELDDRGMDVIFWQCPPAESGWAAIIDRLTRASAS